MTVPNLLRHRFPRMSCGRAKLGAPLSSQPPELCPHTGIIPLQMIDCCLQFPIFPINTTLVALEYALWEHMCFSHPLPRASDSASLQAVSKALFPFLRGWLGFCYPWSWQSMSILGHFGHLPFEGLDRGLKVQPVLLKTATSLVLSKASSDLPHPCPCPHHHCGPVLCYPDGRPIE